MQKSVHELWGGKITIFELPPGPCGQGRELQGQRKSRGCFLGQIPGNGEGGLSYDPFRPEGEF
jgi:hypothetical protein